MKEANGPHLIADGANFLRADLRRAEFPQASFRGASFVRADLTGATFTDADVTGATFQHAAGLDTVQWQNCKGMDSAGIGHLRPV